MLNKTIDNIRNKYGFDAIKRSCFLNSGVDHVIGGVLKEEDKHMLVSKF